MEERVDVEGSSLGQRHGMVQQKVRKFHRYIVRPFNLEGLICQGVSMENYAR